MKREEFFEVANLQYDKRKEQLTQLFQRLNISHATSLLTVGCGTASELEIIDAEQKVAIDHNPSILDYAKSKNQATFLCQNYMEHLDTTTNKYDLILALDIDTNIPTELFIMQSLKHLTENGGILVTEREGNILIYNRMLLLPKIEHLKEKFNCELYTKFSTIPQQDERDNVALLIRK